MNTYGITIPTSTVQDVRDTLEPTDSHVDPLPTPRIVLEARKVSTWRRFFGGK